jgi:hypothetical protein
VLSTVITTYTNAIDLLAQYIHSLVVCLVS